MKRSVVLAIALLWATSIIAAAIVGASGFLTLILLPALAIASLLLLDAAKDRPNATAAESTCRRIEKTNRTSHVTRRAP